jgi:hypothetical protein
VKVLIATMKYGGEDEWDESEKWALKFTEMLLSKKKRRVAVPQANLNY